MTGPEFDLQAAHLHFAVECFNRAWDLIDKEQRMAEDDAAMVQLAHASLWHWTQREDCSNRNLTIGHWQVSRVLALAGQAEAARRAAEFSLAFSDGEPPFYRAYAYEALARAERVAGNSGKATDLAARARDLLHEISDPEQREALIQDLSGL